MVDWKAIFLNPSRPRHDGYERPQESKINILRHVYNFVVGPLKIKIKIGIPERGENLCHSGGTRHIKTACIGCSYHNYCRIHPYE